GGNLVHQNLCTTAPSSDLLISVIVPAKDEEENIRFTLQALNHQVDTWGNSISKQCYEVIVLANNCTDATVTVARQFAREHPNLALHVAEAELPTDCGHIGYVRRQLMDEACYRLSSLGKPEGIIASTDGDTLVEPTWIYHMLRAFEQGADAVGGRILTPKHSGDDRLYHLQDVMYRYLQAHLESLIDPNPADPWPRHFQNFGPSLAVTCDMYERVGRLPVVPFLEDVRFYEALQCYDARIRHCPQVRVVTSTRTAGRVGFGFSKQLQEWAAMRRQRTLPQVPSGSEWIFRFRLQRQLRSAWQQGTFLGLEQIAQRSGAPVHHFYEVMLNATYFGGFLQQVMRSEKMTNFLKQQFPLVPINEAIAQLRGYLFKFNHWSLEMLTELPKGQADTAQFADDGGVVVDH
ncbi:MAG: glycosyltransferase, partial [Cyclobacteriaceae bacterium]